MNVIAEIGNAHGGDLWNAISYVRACAACGVWGVKFQYRIRGDAPQGWGPRVPWHPQFLTRDDYYMRVALQGRDWREVSAECAALAVVPIMSVFSRKGREEFCLESLSENWWLKSPASFLNTDFFDVVSWYPGQLPKTLESGRINLLAMPNYPTSYSDAIAHIDQAKELGMGVSSHCPHPEILHAAAQIGVEYFECHVIWDRRQYTPDSDSSIEVRELKEVMHKVREYERAKDETNRTNTGPDPQKSTID